MHKPFCSSWLLLSQSRGIPPYQGIMKRSRYPNVQYALLTENLRPWRRALIITSKSLAVAFLFAVLSVTTVHLYLTRSQQSLEPATLNAEPGEASLGLVRGPKIVVPEIPSTFRTVGLTFYGRRSRVEILDCYLKVGSSRLGRKNIVSQPDPQCTAQLSRKWWITG